MLLLKVSVAAVLALQEDAIARARLLVERGRVAEAKSFLAASTRKEPDAPALAYLAQLHAATGGLPQAVDALSRALDLAPDQDGLRVTRGAMLFELRRFEEARQELELAVSRRSGLALAHYYLGAVYQALARPDDAEKAALEAIARSPAPQAAPLESMEAEPGVAARHLLAEIRFARGENAESLLREVLEVEPDHASARYLLARTLQKRGEEDEARRELERFEAVKRAESRLVQSRQLLVLGRRKEAMAELAAAVESCPDHARALFLLGRELARGGRGPEAGAIFERLLAIRPDAADEVAPFLPSPR
jgi:tetratricopeptide (TPR) repeat protein